MNTVTCTMLARLPPARFSTWSICENTCFTCASKLLAMSLPVLSRVAVCPATQTILPPSVTTPGEKARESWNGVFSRYSAAPAAMGSASSIGAINFLMVESLFVGIGMQRDAVAFAVEHDGAKAVRADALDRLQHPATLLFSLAHGVAHAAVDVHVDKDPGAAYLLRVRDEAAAVAVGSVLEDRQIHVAGLFLVHLDAEHRGVEAARTFQIGHRQIEPHDPVGAR